MKIDGRAQAEPRTVGAIRFQAVKAVQGWTAANGGGACALGLYPPGYLWLLSCWRMGCASRARRAASEGDGGLSEMDLQYRDIEKSASAAISLCALDESDEAR